MDVKAYVDGLDPSAVNEILSGPQTQYTHIFAKSDDDEIPMAAQFLGFEAAECTDAGLAQTVDGLIKAMKESREYAAVKLLDDSKVWLDVPLTKESFDAEKNKTEGESLLVVSIDQIVEGNRLHGTGQLNGTELFVYDYAQTGWALIPKGKFVWKEQPFCLTVIDGSKVKADDKCGFAQRPYSWRPAFDQ